MMYLRMRPFSDEQSPEIVGQIVGRHRNLSAAKRSLEPGEQIVLQMPRLVSGYQVVAYRTGDMVYAESCRRVD